MSSHIRANVPFVGVVIAAEKGKQLDPDTRREIADYVAERFDVGERVELTVRPYKSKRSLAQNSRYWALLTVGAESIWGDKSLAEDLHDEIAHLLLSLPPCEKTGMRRRMRTPKLNTSEFTVYMDRVAEKLIEFGADLTAWDEESRRMDTEGSVTRRTEAAA